MKYFVNLKLIIFIYFVWSLYSCNSKKCECPISSKDLRYNDSLIAVIKPKLVKTFEEFNQLPLFKSEVESYRLTVLTSVNNFSKIYLLENRNSKYTLTVSEYSNYHDCKDTTELFSKKEIEISQQQWDDFVYEINKNCFWTMAVKNKSRCLDGTSHILEGNLGENNCTKSTYHFVSRNCEFEPGFNILCEKFYRFDLLNYRNIYEYNEAGNDIYDFEDDLVKVKMNYESATWDTLIGNIYLRVNNFVLYDSSFIATSLGKGKEGYNKNLDPENKHRDTKLYEFSSGDMVFEFARVFECDGVLGLKVRFKDSLKAPISVVLKD